MKHFFSLWLFILFFVGAQAQTAENYLKEIAKQQQIDIQWQERKTSLASEGIRSFVGYCEGNFVATLSVGSKAVSGSFHYRDKSYEISLQKGKLVFLPNEKFECGTTDTPHSHSSPSTARPAILAEETAPTIANTQTLRVYRLAMHIPYSTFSTGHLEKNVQKVKAFWADTEAFLNEMYLRVLGVRFEVVKDERLIIKDEDKETFASYRNADYVKDNSTTIINELIGENSYDVGISLAYTASLKKGVRGLAYLEGVYKANTKADAVAVLTKEVIAHEIGHLFGADHTFKNVYSGNSLYTEPSYGQSLMGYSNNFPDGAFFSLPTAYQIRNGIVNRSYFKDSQRTQLVDRNGNDVSNFNYVYGIKTESSFSTIDRTKLQETYTIPKDTYFQFRIKATSPNNLPIYYIAQLTNRAGVNDPKFLTRKGKTEGNPITFQTQYSDLGGFIEYTRPNAKGEHLFWVATSNPAPQRFVNYDMVAVKVNIADGKTFAITNGMNEEYQGGDKITLHWQVDSNFFDPNSKVRILLSDDFGKTFKYTLVESTENDGTCEVTLPNIEIGTVEWGKQPKIQLPAGVIKVEVIDHIAFAITNVAPYKISNGKSVPNGGFKIKKKTETPSPAEDSKPQQEPEKNIVIYNGVSTENTNNYFTVEGADDNSPIHLLIFDEMGLKVYENEHYGKNGDYFRGNANAKGFIGNNKALHGTYFYIVRYSKHGKEEQQRGFLYVR